MPKDLNLDKVDFTFLTSELKKGKWITKSGDLNSVDKDSGWDRFFNNLFDWSYLFENKAHYRKINADRIITKLEQAYQKGADSLDEQRRFEFDLFLSTFNQATKARHQTRIDALKNQLCPQLDPLFENLPQLIDLEDEHLSNIGGRLRIRFLAQGLSLNLLKSELSNLSKKEVEKVLAIMLGDILDEKAEKICLDYALNKNYGYFFSFIQTAYSDLKVVPDFNRKRQHELNQKLTHWIRSNEEWENDPDEIKLIRATLRFLNKQKIGTEDDQKQLLFQVIQAEKKLANQQIISPRECHFNGIFKETDLVDTPLMKPSPNYNPNVQLAPLGSLGWDKSFQENMKLLKSYNTYIKILIKHEEIEIIDRELIRLLHSLLPIEKSDDFLKTLNDEELKKLSNALFKMTNELASNHYRLQRSQLPPQHVKTLLRLLEIQQQILTYHSRTATLFKDRDYKFDIDCLYKGLNDPYYDLGSDATEIYAIYQRMDRPNVKFPYRKSTAIALTSVDDRHYKDFLLALHPGMPLKNGPYSAVLTKRDVGSNCSALGNARETYFYLTLLLLESYVLFDDVPNFMVSKTTDPDIIKKQMEQDQKIVAKQKMNFKTSGRLSINYDTNGGYFLIPALDLIMLGAAESYASKYSYDSFDQIFANHRDGAISQNRTGERRIHQEAVRSNLAESVVVVGALDKNEIGSGGNGLFRYTGTLQTQDQIQRGNVNFKHLSKGKTQELQLMQTAPADRVRNTLIQLLDKFYLTTITKREGLDWQNIFRLNLFRIGMIERGLEAAPSWIFQILETFEKLKIEIQKQDAPKEYYLRLLGDMVANIGASQWLDSDKKNLMARHLHQVLDDLWFTEIAPIFKTKENVVSSSTVKLLLAVAYAGGALAKLGVESPEFKMRRLQILFLLVGSPRSKFSDNDWVVVVTSLDEVLDSLSPIEKENNLFLNQMISLKYPSTEIEWQQTEHQHCYISSEGDKQLDLRQGKISTLNDSNKEGKRFPPAIRAVLANWLPEATLKKIKFHSTKEIDSKRYSLCRFIDMAGFEWRVLYCKENDFYIQRQMKKPDSEETIWVDFQKASLTEFEKSHWPNDLQNCSCWWHAENSTVYFLSDKGKLSYSASYEFASKRLTGFQQHFLGYTSVVYFLDQETDKAFSGSAESGNLIFLNNEQDVPLIYNTSISVYFLWNEDKGHWGLSILPDHHLIPREEARKLAVSRQNHPDYFTKKVPLIPETFNAFTAFKDDKTGQIKILMPVTAYKRIKSKIGKELQLYEPIQNNQNTSVTYLIDPEKGLLAETVVGVFNLAYVFYMHGKYNETLKHLQLGIKRLVKWSSEISNLVSWIENWPIKDPNGLAVTMHLKLMVQEWRELHIGSEDDCRACEANVDSILEMYGRYKEKVSEIDGQLHLHPDSQKKINSLLFQSYQNLCKQFPVALEEDTGQEQIQNKIEPQVISIEQALAINAEQLKPEMSPFLARFRARFPFLKAVPKEMLDWCEDLKNVGYLYQIGDVLYFYGKGLLVQKNNRLVVNVENPENLQIELTKYALQKELHERLESLPKPEDPLCVDIPKAIEVNIYPVDIGQFFESGRPDALNTEAVKVNLKALEGLKGQDVYLNELIDNMIKDAKVYCRAKGYDLDGEAKGVPQIQLKDDCDFVSMSGLFSHHAKEIKHQIDVKKASITKMFHLDLKGHPLERQIHGQYALVEDLFQEAKWCYACSNWQPLIDKKIISEDQIDDLSQFVREYLELRTSHQQHVKLIKQLELCQNQPKDFSKREQLASLLSQKRRYDPSSHPYAPVLLILEEEQTSFSGSGIILTARQLDHFIEMIEHRGAFKHEVWGGGKTSVLRVLISWFHANGRMLSGMFTLGSLIDQHDPLYHEITAKASGQRVVRIDFSRSTPTDTVSLLRQFLALVHTVEHRGRIDQTLASFINLGHAAKEKIIQNGAYEEVQILQQMQKFYNERAIFGSDELDQLTTPDKQYNYSAGERCNLEKFHFRPGLEIMKLLLSPEYKEYLPYFKTKKTTDLSESKRGELIKRLACDIAPKFKDIDVQMLVAYFLDDPSVAHDEKVLFYDKIVTNHPDFSEIVSYQLFFQSIISTGLSKKYGVRYMRSEDGIHTKPANESGNPAENSHFSTNGMHVFFTVLDYLRFGASIKGIPTYIIQLKDELIRNHKKAKALQERFLHSFNIELEKVNESHYPHILDVINNKTEWLVDFIEKANFRLEKVFTKKIYGSAALGANSIKEIWGSSGNAESLHALPRKIQRVDKLIHQEQTMGSVFVNLIQDIAKNDSLIGYDYLSPFSEVVKKHLFPGSGLIDAGAILAGQESETIAGNLCNSTGISVRFLRNGQLHVKKSSEQEQRDDKDVSANNQITLLTVKDTRGTDLLFPKESRHVITVSGSTTYGEFSQAGNRMRDWGKGQTMQYLVDPALQEKLGQPSIKTAPLAAKMMWIFLSNEVEAQKPKNFLTNEAEILSIGLQAVNQAFNECKDEQEYRKLRSRILERTPKLLENDNNLSIDQLGAPKKPESPLEKLNHLIDAQKTSLSLICQPDDNKEALLDELDEESSEVEIHEDESNALRDEILAPFFDALRKLSQQRGLLLKLQAYLGASTIDQDEELAIEVDLDVEVQVSQELQLEFNLEEEFDFEKDIREHYAYSQHCFKPQKLESDLCKDLILMTSLNHLSVSDWRKGCKGEQLYAPAVLFSCVKDDIRGTLGPVKYMDLFATTDDFSMTRKPRMKPVIPENELFCFKWDEPLDIRQYGKGIGLSEEQIRKAEVAVAFAKFHYGAVKTLTEAEENILLGWLQTRSDLDKLHTALNNYLTAYFDRSKSWPVLALFDHI